MANLGSRIKALEVTFLPKAMHELRTGYWVEGGLHEIIDGKLVKVVEVPRNVTYLSEDDWNL